jgi:hypothetical protein
LIIEIVQQIKSDDSFKMLPPAVVIKQIRMAHPKNGLVHDYRERILLAPLLTPYTLAAQYGCGIETILRWRREGRLQGSRSVVVSTGFSVTSSSSGPSGRSPGTPVSTKQANQQKPLKTNLMSNRKKRLRQTCRASRPCECRNDAKISVSPRPVPGEPHQGSRIVADMEVGLLR